MSTTFNLFSSPPSDRRMQKWSLFAFVVGCIFLNLRVSISLQIYTWFFYQSCHLGSNDLSLSLSLSHTHTHTHTNSLFLMCENRSTWKRNWTCSTDRPSVFDPSLSLVQSLNELKNTGSPVSKYWQLQWQKKEIFTRLHYLTFICSWTELRYPSTKYVDHQQLPSSIYLFISVCLSHFPSTDMSLNALCLHLCFLFLFWLLLQFFFNIKTFSVTLSLFLYLSVCVFIFPYYSLLVCFTFLVLFTLLVCFTLSLFLSLSVCVFHNLSLL